MRMALGASSPSLLRLVQGEGLMLVAIGLPLVRSRPFAAARLLTTVRFQVRPHDP